MDRVAMVLRLINALLAGGVAGLCFLRVNWTDETRARDTRVAGLGLICVAIAWGSFARRDEVFKPWIPLVTIGLALCVYGMRRIAAGELARVRR